MILHRAVFQAKFGQADAVVAGFKVMAANSFSEIPEPIRPIEMRILTDLSGEFDTVTFETVHHSLASYEQFRKLLFSSAEFADEQSQGMDLIVSGRNEFYTIES